MNILEQKVVDLVIDSFYARFGLFCDWMSLTFDQLAWLEIYANKNGLTLERVKERWEEL